MAAPQNAAAKTHFEYDIALPKNGAWSVCRQSASEFLAKPAGFAKALSPHAPLRSTPITTTRLKLVFVVTTIMRITYDPNKRAKTLSVRGLDFDDAALVFAGETFETEDARKDYGERRVICFGYLRDRLVVVVYTPRGEDRHVFSMRNANEREKARIAAAREV